MEQINISQMATNEGNKKRKHTALADPPPPGGGHHLDTSGIACRRPEAPAADPPAFSRGKPPAAALSCAPRPLDRGPSSPISAPRATSRLPASGHLLGAFSLDRSPLSSFPSFISFVNGPERPNKASPKIFLKQEALTARILKWTLFKPNGPFLVFCYVGSGFKS